VCGTMSVTVETADRVNTNTVLAEVGACKILSRDASDLGGRGGVHGADGSSVVRGLWQGVSRPGNTVRRCRMVGGMR